MKVEAIRREIELLRNALRDPRVPRRSKAIAWLSISYLASPIDLIPDFIPILGQLDDIILVPAGIWLAWKSIPADVRRELRSGQNAR